MIKIEHEHDTGYKRVFSRKRHFLHFLKKYIYADWVNNIDEKDLDLIDTTLIDEEYRNKESDVIYKLKFKGREIIFYVLLELQSTVDHTMPFRLLRYMVELMKREFDNTPENKRKSADYRMPAVLPIIMYNGGDKWTVVQSFKEYLQGYEQFGGYIIDFKYLLLDINRMTDETILSTNMLLDIIFMLDKNPNRKSMKKSLDIAAKEFRSMGKFDRLDMINWIRYIYLNNVQDDGLKNELLKDFERGDVKNMVYGIDRAFEAERLKGEKKAEKKAHKEKINMVKNLIKMGLSNSQISEATDFTMSEAYIGTLRDDNQNDTDK